MLLDPRIFARLALAAYADPPDIGKAESASRSTLRQIDGRRIVTFRGSDNFTTWLADLQCTRATTSLGVVHGGFREAERENYRDIRSIEPQVIGGHSEGADVALLTAGDLCLDGKPPLAVFAFEPARCCLDDVLETILRAHGVEVFITWHGRDVVPIVPRILFPWRHAWPDITRLAEPLEAFDACIEDHRMESVIPALDAHVAAQSAD